MKGRNRWGNRFGELTDDRREAWYVWVMMNDAALIIKSGFGQSRLDFWNGTNPWALVMRETIYWHSKQ